MKITCISTSHVPSDTANSIQVMKACQALVQLGHSVHLMVPGQQPAARESLMDHYGLSMPFDISWFPSHPRWKHNDFAWRAVRRAFKMGADVVYTWTGQSAVFSLLHRIPVIYEVHDLPTGILGPVWFRLFLDLPGQKRLVVITRALQKALERQFGMIEKSSIVIAPNGFDLDQYADLPPADQARKALGLPQMLTVLCSGHLYTGRGIDLFLGVAERFPQVNFVWAGGRVEDVTKYRARADSYGLKNVLFTGFISQSRLPLYQAAADVLLMPYARSIAGSGGGNSADICSPMKMFDYLAAGRAILSSDLPVIHEVLNETNAVFAPPEDVEAWVAALERILANEDLRKNLAAQSTQDAPFFTWKARADRVLAGFNIK
jgi:glycosyltransferase involved in cell wall biosynthesis